MNVLKFYNNYGCVGMCVYCVCLGITYENIDYRRQIK